MFINLVPSCHSTDITDTIARYGVTKSILCIHCSVKGRWTGCSVSTWDMRTHEVIMKMAECYLNSRRAFCMWETYLKCTQIFMNASLLSQTCGCHVHSSRKDVKQTQDVHVFQMSKRWDGLGHENQMQVVVRQEWKRLKRLSFWTVSKERAGARLWSFQALKFAFLDALESSIWLKSRTQKESFKDSHSSYDK